MPTLKETAIAYKGKRELWDLDKIPIDTEIKEDKFDGKDNSGNPAKIPYSYIEIEGYKYTIRADVIRQIQNVIANRPTVNFVKVTKTPKGEVFVMPID